MISKVRKGNAGFHGGMPPVWPIVVTWSTRPAGPTHPAKKRSDPIKRCPITSGKAAQVPRCSCVSRAGNHGPFQVAFFQQTRLEGADYFAQERIGFNVDPFSQSAFTVCACLYIKEIARTDSQPAQFTGSCF